MQRNNFVCPCPHLNKEKTVQWIYVKNLAKNIEIVFESKKNIHLVLKNPIL